MVKIFERATLKELAKSQLKGKWGSGVLVTFVYGLLTIASSVLGIIPGIGGIFSILITAPLAIGLLITYINFVKSNSELEVGDLFKGFNIYGKSLGITLWYALWVILWFLLLIIPGFIKALAYSQSMYIIADNPNVKVRTALKISIKMTFGYKWEIFVMGLSFIGWALLCVLSLGIGFLWLTPYMNTTYTNMFYKLKEISLQRGLCTEDEFNGAVSLT
jgi:uncharacterized membrane protein